MGSHSQKLTVSCRECDKFRARLRRLEDELSRTRPEAHPHCDTLALAESERKYRSLFEDSQDAIYISTPEGKILDINPAGVRLFGYASKEKLLRADIGRDLYLNPEEREYCLKLLERDGCLKDQELHLRRRDGAILVILETTVSVRDAEGRIVSYRGFLRDVTEQKALEEQLLQAQRLEAVGRLAGGVAHDFNNLLTVISGYSENILRRLDADHPVCREIGIISKAAESAAGLTNQLLAFSRQQTLQPKLFDLNAVLREMQEMIQRLIGEDVTMIVHLNRGTRQVKADRTQLEQVIMNLVVNARDAMAHGGELTIETWNADLAGKAMKWAPLVEPGSYVALVVSDTGCGMESEILAHIFEPFYTTKDPSKGTGLGLSTTYGIVKQSGGYILADSTPGAGSTFTILLPRVDSAAAEPDEPRIRPENLQGTETILLVEDNEMVREMVYQVLMDHGYTVLDAGQPNEALAICDGLEEPFDLLLTDMVMPGMNGQQLSLELLCRYPGIGVLFMSGYTARHLKNLDDAPPKHVLIRKPFTLGSLLTEVRRALDERAGRQRCGE